MPSFEDRKAARDGNARELQRMFEKSGESREDAGRKAREMADKAAQRSDEQRRQK